MRPPGLISRTGTSSVAAMEILTVGCLSAPASSYAQECWRKQQLGRLTRCLALGLTFSKRQSCFWFNMLAHEPKILRTQCLGDTGPGQP